MIMGNRVRLRAIERADLPRFVKWFGDPEVRDGLELFAPTGEAQEDLASERNLERPTAEQAWAIDAQTTAAAAGLPPAAAESAWTHIGSCGFHPVDWRSRAAECGIAIGDKTQWGKGYGTEAMRTLVGFGFDTLNLHRIMLSVFDDNARAIRCYEKVGFKTEGRLRESNCHNGRYRDALIMAVLRAEWGTR